MKTLETQFEKQGWNFKQLHRIGDAAMYQKQKDGGPISLEVIKVDRHNGRKFPNGTEVGPAEFYPSDSSWGQSGFTYSNANGGVEAAERKFKELVEQQK